MKRYIRLLCIALVCGLFVSLPAQAAESTEIVEPRESAYFSLHSVLLTKTSATAFTVWFEVLANAQIMDEIGAREIRVYRSPDGETWSKVRTYNKENFPTMIDYNTGYHMASVNYTAAWEGYYYRATIILYAKTGNNIGERVRYTDIVRM